MVRITRRKTGRAVAVPVLGELREALDAAPQISPTIVVNERTGWPYNAYTFGHDFRRIANEVGLEDLQFRDLRRTGLVRLAEAGCTVIECAAISGHSIARSAAILETYIPASTPMARSAITRLEAYRARSRTEVGKVR